jgi:hypothetical protein
LGAAIHFTMMLTYKLVIAKMFGLIVMPTMDQACFVSNSKAHVNCSSTQFFEGEFTNESFKRIYKEQIMIDFPKFTYRVVMKFGDLYYEKMDIDSTFEKCYFYLDDPKKMVYS